MRDDRSLLRNCHGLTIAALITLATVAFVSGATPEAVRRVQADAGRGNPSVEVPEEQVRSDWQRYVDQNTEGATRLKSIGATPCVERVRFGPMSVIGTSPEGSSAAVLIRLTGDWIGPADPQRALPSGPCAGFDPMLGTGQQVERIMIYRRFGSVWRLQSLQDDATPVGPRQPPATLRTAPDAPQSAGSGGVGPSPTVASAPAASRDACDSHDACLESLRKAILVGDVATAESALERALSSSEPVAIGLCRDGGWKCRMGSLLLSLDRVAFEEEGGKVAFSTTPSGITAPMAWRDKVFHAPAGAVGKVRFTALGKKQEFSYLPENIECDRREVITCSHLGLRQQEFVANLVAHALEVLPSLKPAAQHGLAAPSLGKVSAGLQFESLRQGEGPAPRPPDRVLVKIVASLADGAPVHGYDKPYWITLDRNGAIACLLEGIPRMRVGAKAKITCPPDLAYAERGVPPDIPPNAVLHFEIDLLDVRSSEAKGGDVPPEPTPDRPPLPHIEKGALFREGQTGYGSWVTKTPLELRATPDELAPVAVRVAAGSTLRTETVESHTLQYGELVVTVDKSRWAFAVSQPTVGRFGGASAKPEETTLQLRRGDRLFIANEYGEGTCRLWLGGSFYDSPCGNHAAWATKEKDLVVQAWSLVRTSSGESGWLEGAWGLETAH